MAINDFVRRSIQIVGGGIAQSTTDYFDSAISFTNDVKEIMDMGRQMGSDGVKKFNELKNSGILKKTRDWFYNEGGMFGDFDFDDDDFDAGFEIESADSESKESSKPLSKDMMTDIAKKQTGAMYKALGRQADLQIANTAEIISTINTRTAELTASVNNVNNTIIQIGKRLDLIVEWTSARTKKEEQEKRQAGILDYGGGISLSGVVNKAKENAEDSMLGTFLSIGKTMLGSGMMTPEMVMSMILSQTILDKKWDKLGKKSINDIGEFINDTVDEVIQNTMTKILTSKNSVLETIFEDIISRNVSKNYQSYASNQYNDKPAVFDGMTRKSIISVIPGYLNEILKAVSKDGSGREIDNKGNLTKNKSNHFISTISENYFRAGSVDYKVQESMAERTRLTSKEVQNAMRALTGSWVWYMYGSDRTLLNIGEVKDVTAESTAAVINEAARMMAETDPKHRSIGEWKLLFHGIVEKIPEFEYRKNIQQTAERSHKALVEGARGLHGNQYKYVDRSAFEQGWRKSFSDFNRDVEFHEPEAKTTQISSNSNQIQPSTSDYVAGILHRLNTGINVFVTGQASARNSQRDPYKPITITKAIKTIVANTTSTTPTTTVSPAPAVQNPIDVLGDAVKNKKNEKLYNEAPDAIKELYDIPFSERTKDQQKQISDWEHDYKKEHKRFTLKGQAVNPIALIPEDSTLRKSISEVVKDVIPDSVKDIFSKGKEKVLKTEIGQKAANKINQLDEKATNKLFGEVTTTDGTTTRSGGLIQKGIDKAKDKYTSASDRLTELATNVTPTSVLKSRTEKLINEYGPDKEFDESDKNALHMQAISSMMNVAMSDGSMSNIDEQTLYREINSIDDPDIQKQLKQSVIPLMKRNSKSDDKQTKQGDNTLGKLGKLLFGGFKMAIVPIITYVRIVLWSVFKIIKTGVTTILKFGLRGIKKGLINIKTGMKNVANGVTKMFVPLASVAKQAINVTYAVATKINDFVKTMHEKLTDVFSKVKETISAKFGDLFKKKEDTSQNEGDENKSVVGKVKDKLSNINHKVGDAVSQSALGRGFVKALRDRKEAQSKAKLKEEAAPIKEGIETSEIGKDLKSALESEDGKKGWFKKITSLLQGIFDKTPDKKESDVPETKTDIKNDETQKTTDTSQKTEKTSEESTTSKSSGKTKSSKKSTTKTPSTPGGAPGGASGGGGLKGAVSKIGGAIKGGATSVLEGIGEAVGGLTSIMGGLLQVVLSIVMSLEGFKALTNLVMDILKESLEPLNEAFQAITKAIKPILKQLGGIIKQLAEFIVVIVDAVVDVIKPIITDVVQPVLEVVAPLLQSIIECLTPLLKIVGILLKVIMAPLMGLFKFVLLPILKIIGDVVQIIMGVLQTGFGLIMMGIGAIIAAFGGLISLVGKIPMLGAAGNVGEGILNTGKDMMEQGKGFVTSGKDAVVQGVKNYILDGTNMLSLGAVNEATGKNDESEQNQTKQIEAAENSDTVQNTYANGDITNIYNTYGGEYQRGMGGYLNMNQRGCGPIALADMYNRNTNGGINARSLAGSMYGNGTYDPRRGTSVGGYIESARSLGMHLTPGKVTQQSLKSASPNHPITVVGSGSDYGTRNGNNHFMNVIGTDHHGGAYVSNPLTGRIDRKPASTVAGSAVVGLYGSGDEADGSYTFPDAIKEAFKKLKEEAAKILGLFSMEKSDEEEIEDSLNSEKKKEAVEQAKKQLGDKYSEYEKKAKAYAFDDFKIKYPQKDGESDEDYDKRFENWWENTCNQSEYIAKTKILDAASTDQKDAWSTISKTSEEMVNAYAGDDGLFNKLGNAYTDLNSNISSLGSSSGSGGSGYFTSDEGVPLWVPYSDNIEITDTNINDSPYHSPLFEFFAKTMGMNIGDVKGTGWYSHYNNPNKEGVGSAGEEHPGVDFSDGLNGSKIYGKPLYATTGGKVELKRYQAGGGGNYVAWRDSAGKLHWYMHMAEPSPVNEGDEIQGGDILGYVGYSGNVDPAGKAGTHLHYSINDSTTSSGAGNRFNPLMYFKNYNPTGGLVGGTDTEKIWAYLTSHGFLPHTAAAAMGNFEVESHNDPATPEGYYAFDTGTVQAALRDYDSMDDYVVNKLFPYYDRSGKSINKPGYRGDDGHYYPGIGLAQWTGSRSRALSDYTVAKGLPWSDLAGQLDYLNKEVGESYSRTLSAANNSNDVNAATELWLSGFEVNPGDKLAERQRYAKEFYDRYINWTPETKKTWNPNNQGDMSSGWSLANSAADGKRIDNCNQIKTFDGKNTGDVNAEGGLNLRADKNVDSTSLIIIPNGTNLNLEASGSPQWFKTTWGGKTGYVSSAYILLDRDSQNEQDYSPAGSSGTYNGTINSLGDANLADGETPIVMGDYGVKQNGSNNNETVVVKSKIPWEASDPKWDSSWYFNQKNYSEFLTQDSKNPKSGGPLYDLEDMSDLLFSQNGNNEYGKNLERKYGYDTDEVLKKMRKNGYTAKDWLKLRKQYIAPDKKANKNLFPASLENLHYAMYGSGDVSTEDQFWNTYMNWNNNSPSVLSPMSDGSDTMYDYNSYDNTSDGVVVNNYSITRGEDTDAEKRVKAALANTYNVRSESMEALLVAILEELRKRRDPRGGNNTNGSTKLFDERIPTQVTKLSIG